MIEQMNSGNMWKDDISKRQFKKISPTEMRYLGLTEDNVNHVDTLEELRESPPNIIIAEAARNVKFVQNWFKEQELRKKVKYVMGLGVFQQLHFDSQSGKNKLLKPSNIKFNNMYRPYIGQDAENATILVFRTGGIGDLLFIQPNLRYLKEKYPTCTIWFACGPQYQPMVRNWSCVDEVLDLPFTFSRLKDADYHMLFEGVIERCKEAETSNAYNLFSHWLGLDLPDNILLPRQTPVEELVDKCKEVLDKWKIDNFILMQLRASSLIRTPRHQFWAKIINELNRRGRNVVLTDNPRQAENVDKFIGELDHKNTFNFCQYSDSIAYTIALASLSNGTLATDSALGHISASLDVPFVGIYGPFPGYIRLKTYPKAIWIDANRHCSPCFIHGHKPCPQAATDGYSPCYDDLINSDEKLKSLVDKVEDYIYV